MKSKITHDVRIQFLKFIGVGVLNTLISLLVIYLLMQLGSDYKLANLAGYVAGVINSFIWNKRWVFDSRKSVWRELFWFGISFIICFALQYMILLVLVEQFNWNKYFSQLIAMGVYTVANFVLNRLITFRK